MHSQACFPTNAYAKKGFNRGALTVLQPTCTNHGNKSTNNHPLTLYQGFNLNGAAIPQTYNYPPSMARSMSHCIILHPTPVMGNAYSFIPESGVENDMPVQVPGSSDILGTVRVRPDLRSSSEEAQVPSLDCKDRKSAKRQRLQQPETPHLDMKRIKPSVFKVRHQEMMKFFNLIGKDGKSENKNEDPYKPNVTYKTTVSYA